MSFRTTIAAALTACLLLVASAAEAEPALWAAHGPNSTVYLFGTVHVLRSDTVWRSPKIAAAFARSGDLWLETADGGTDAAAAQGLTLQLGIDAAHPLSKSIAPDDVRRVDDAAKAIGISAGEAAFEPMRPWLVAVALSIGPMLKAGFDPARGVDRQLRADAVAQSKPISGFETASQQLHYFADMPDALQVAYLHHVLDDYANGPAILNGLVDAWAAGDVDALARLETNAFNDSERPLYDTLIRKRNVEWADRLAARLQQPGISFVAVGAGHLTGTDAIQGLLAQRGIRVTRE
jgi:uncharacterized protein YbaP (TraB family)